MGRISRSTWAAGCLLGVALLGAGAALGADDAPGFPGELRGRAERAIRRGLEYLAATQQPDGGWTHAGQTNPAITALAARGFVQHPDYGRDHPHVRRAIELVLRHRQPDGGIYVPDAGLHNYHTSVCLALLAATRDPAYREIVRGAQSYLKKIQWDETEDVDAASPWYGGAGYGRGKRPDLSNTQMMIEALHESGLSKTDPAYRKALQFIQRSQMRSESNDQPFARGADDGGFIYSPVGEGESKAGYDVREDGRRLRSYGSMTYAGFKSMLYAGLTRDDPRVRAAYDWIRTNYTLDHNANMPGAQSMEGYYYYLHVVAKALRAWGRDTLVDSGGIEHDWRRELCEQLLARQAPDGSWVNTADRWLEGNPHLVTAYAVLALQETLAPPLP